MGSHTCSGNMPALAPKPSRISTPAASTLGSARLSAEEPAPCSVSDRPAKDRVPVVRSRSTRPMNINRPPITAINK